MTSRLIFKWSPNWQFAPLVFGLCLSTLLASRAGAMPSPLEPLHLRPGKVSPPMQSGELIGGKAGGEFSLVSISNEKILGHGTERFVITYGDRFGKPLHGEPGYFHLALDHGARRLVIDLAQVDRTAVDPSKLSRILASSELVATSEMTMDPSDGSTNITLTTKVPIKVRVTAADEDHGKLKIEMIANGAAGL